MDYGCVCVCLLCSLVLYCLLWLDCGCLWFDVVIGLLLVWFFLVFVGVNG